MKRIVVVGANGQLGSDIAAVWEGRGEDVRRLTHQDISIENYANVLETMEALKPDIVINTAAFHVVPRCEQEPLRAYEVNAIGSRNVASACEKVGASVVYVSTDYVFDGKKRSPYVEADGPNPLNVYGHSKLSGEYYTLNECSRGFVLRVSGIYGAVPCRAKGGNFITTMIRLAKERDEVRVVDDEILTPTPTVAIAEAVFDVCTRGKPALYHATAEGSCSWYEFARVIFDTLSLTTPLSPISSTEMPPGVRRPMYSVLENSRLHNDSLYKMPHWRDGLLTFLAKEFGR